MPTSARSKQRPWIEALILSYGGEQSSSSSSSERLKARVIRVEQMSQSQAQNSECPTGLLLLSDGFLLIPAVLTAAAWERLQEQEDRDSLDGLVNSTVVIQDYRLQFHMSPEQTKCRFFLLVGELAMTSAGPSGCNTPCCTTLASVRRKICQTWKGLLEEKGQDSQSSQSGLDLSMLLGEWHQDCMLGILRDVEDRLLELPCRLPRTSTAEPTRPHASTSWDVDRLRFRGEKSFSVPVRCLLFPGVVQLQAADNTASQAVPEDGASQRDWDLGPPVGRAQAAAGTELDASQDLPVSEDHMIDGVIDASVRPLSNAWDIFTPPGHSPRSSDASAAETPAQVCRSPSASAPLLPERSCLPPYQQPPQLHLHATAGASTSEGASQASTGATDTAQLQLPVSEGPGEGGAKRRRWQPAAGDEDAEASRSPPSWLFDTQTDYGAPQPQQQQQSALRNTPSLHSDGRSFSYSYQVSGQHLQDLSRFTVRTAWLQWAIRYLLRPERNLDPASEQGSSEGCRM